MTREQFLALAGQLYDAHAGGGSTTSSGTPPRFDTALPAGQGLVIYASECSAKELRYQLGRSEKPPAPGKEQYAEQNQKRAKAIRYWLEWREANPGAVWTGERNRRTVTALPPADKPQQHAREARQEAPPSDAASVDDLPF